jgi:uncharacterized protein DUF3310
MSDDDLMKRALASQINEEVPEVRQALDAAFKEHTIKDGKNLTGGGPLIYPDGMLVSGERPSKVDMVNHPAHYGGADNPYEVIKVIDAWRLGFALGNTVKYIARAPHKGSELEDLRKARWYLNHRIEQLEALHNIQLDRPVRPMPGPGK